MDKDIKKLANSEINDIKSEIKDYRKQIAELSKKIADAESRQKVISERAMKPCTLNKCCHNWESCWCSGQLACGNCSSFETSAQYEERMDRAYEEMRKYHL